MNDTPQGERTHIAFFGLRNVGKSSLVNAVTGQELSIVSEHKGTTTDPVQKAMEILPLGPCLIIDTPGLDDEGDLGAKRMDKARQVLRRCDVAVFVTEAGRRLTKEEAELCALIKAQDIPMLLVANKCDLARNCVTDADLLVSAKEGLGINELKEALARLGQSRTKPKILVADHLCRGQTAVLVIPIDSAAPKGRIILPQQQVLRELIEAEVTTIVVAPSRLPSVLRTSSVDLVITDSQVFEEVAKCTPPSIPLTSFSILMARYKGYLKAAVAGVQSIAHLPNKATILMAEGCTHHRQCEDIGTVKIPRWLAAHTKKELTFVTSSGRDFPADLSPFDLCVLCGSCMLNEREVQARVARCVEQAIPVTNYGILIAHMRAILARSIDLFKEELQC